MAEPKVPLAAERLMDVKLNQLGSWLMSRDFTPSGIFTSLVRGRNRYLDKYIFVKNAGIGGLALVIAAYSTVSYVWYYEELKHERMRKYH
ncbi:ATP synthase F(0) complex subunit f, mitochondrial [Aulostomus maculatus]